VVKWGLFSRKGLESLAGSTARLNIWEGSVRSGKTVCSIVRWLEYVRRGPPGDLLMSGKTERTLKRNILDPIAEIVGHRRFAYNRGLGELMLCGRRAYVTGANDERSEGKIRGLTLAGAYGDELSLWPESYFKMLLSRLSVAGARFFGTTNPDFPTHWLKVEYLDNPGLDLSVWHFTLDDNPNLDPAYVAALKSEYTGVWYQRYIQGLWVAAEGAIYKDAWSDEENLFDDDTPGLDQDMRIRAANRRYIAVDYGTANPMVYLDIIDDGRALWVVNEYYYDSRKTGVEKTDGQYADDLQAFIAEAGQHGIAPAAIIVDPSAASFKAELSRRRLFTRDLGETVNADNEVLDGIRMVSTMLHRRLIRVHKTRCPMLHKELTSYVWDDKWIQKGGKERPVKINDHTCDALRYLVRTVIHPRRLTA